MEDILARWKETKRYSLFSNLELPEKLIDNIVDDVVYIGDEADLLHNHGVWDQSLASDIFRCIVKHT